MYFKALVATLVLAASTAAIAADEPDTRTPLDRYRGDTQYSMLMCGLSFKFHQQKVELAGRDSSTEGDYPGCIKEGKAKSKVNLDKALRTIKKAKAQDALKTYHVAFVSALEGINPGSDELRISYQQRQQALNDKLNEAWARFEVEQ